MKIGDLVKLRFSGAECVGIVVEEFIHDLAHRHITELRVQWLDDAGKDISWVRRKDLEIVNANR